MTQGTRFHVISDLLLNISLLRKSNRDYQQEQNEWIEKELETCFATYCVVAGHHPMYSIGLHGPTKKVIKYLEPMLVSEIIQAET